MLRRHAAKFMMILIGIPVGIGFFTVHYAGGTSYLSTDPAACANCHIMNAQYDSWQKSSHHGMATCVDCHLPQDFIGKYKAKILNGYHHSKGFTFQDFDEPITVKEPNAQILQDNCVRCHDALLHETVLDAADRGDGLRCVHCHRSVGHGPRAGLGGPDRGQAAERKGS